MSSVKHILPDASVYEHVEKLGLAFDGQTFPSALSPVFDQLVSKLGAKVVIEVGSHKGGSAVRWAEAMGADGKLYCVDTWLESAEAVLNNSKTYTILRQNGHPMTYWQFLTNMKSRGLQDRVVPIVNTSAEGAILLGAAEVVADIIYVDASHTFRAAYQDICDYWPLLRKGGVMLVDDLTIYPDVYAAMLRFVSEQGLWSSFEAVDNNTFGLLTKPL
tara:strand:+ start:34 stop:684 length:651 start_codon:yes stop_codon:yes gene_type:complete